MEILLPLSRKNFFYMEREMEKKRRRLGILAAAAVVLALGLVALGCKTTPLLTEDGLFEYAVRQSIGKKVVYITKYIGTETDIVIPAQIDGNEIYAIMGTNPFASMSEKFVGMFEGKSITSVVFPKSLRNIELRAFANNNLTSITLPDNVYINSSVFTGNPITSFTLGADIKSQQNSLNALTPYYFGNNRQAGVYTLNDGKWECDGSVLRLPAIIKTIDSKENSITMTAFNGKVFSIMTSNPYEIGRSEYWIPAGTHTLGISQSEKKGASVAASGPGTPLRGDFQAGIIYEITEKADKTLECKAVGPWTPPQ